MSVIKIDPSYKPFIELESKKDYFIQLKERLKEEYNNYEIYPSKSRIFKALELTSLGTTKVIILGQDPYHTPGVASGLAFHSNKDNYIPPSLKNIIKEVKRDHQEFLEPNKHYIIDLVDWAKEGVLLLNTCLTVKQSVANSHKDLGWHQFTSNLLRFIITYKVSNKEPFVILLWGSFAQRYLQEVLNSLEFEQESSQYIKILKASHPSPFSYDKGFKNCNHFILSNKFLEGKGKSPINWIKEKV